METDYKLNDKFNAPVEEAYKILRTNIQFCGIDRNRTLTITSCNPGEGKTTVAMNLAIMIAKSGVKVLLIDADLRKPITAKQFGNEEAIGLSNVLAGFNTLDEAVNATNLSNLFYLPCGSKPPNPTELLNSPNFLELILNVQNDYGAVIFDTPPLGSVIDAAVIASQTDSTIVVIESGAVNAESILRVKEQLEKDPGAKDILINNVGPVIGAHSGPGTLALFFVGAQR
jgi:capsular exopolysaccharide synthesis family protein